MKLMDIRLILFGIYHNREVSILKKRFRIIISLLLAVSLGGCQLRVNKKIEINTIDSLSALNDESNEFNIKNEWHLYIFGHDVTSEIPVILVTSDDDIWTCVPLVATIKELGIQVTWEDQNHAVLKYERNKLYLDAEKQIIHPGHYEGNELDTVTGGKYYYKFVGNEVLVCSSVFMSICFQLGMKVHCFVLDKSKTVDIDFLNTGDGSLS